MKKKSTDEVSSNIIKDMMNYLVNGEMKEFKVSENNDEESMKEAVEKALKQIEEKQLLLQLFFLLKVPFYL